MECYENTSVFSTFVNEQCIISILRKCTSILYFKCNTVLAEPVIIWRPFRVINTQIEKLRIKESCWFENGNWTREELPMYLLPPKNKKIIKFCSLKRNPYEINVISSAHWCQNTRHTVEIWVFMSFEYGRALFETIYCSLVWFPRWKLTFGDIIPASLMTDLLLFQFSFRIHGWHCVGYAYIHL